jgi:hypothetical protein
MARHTWPAYQEPGGCAADWCAGKGISLSASDDYSECKEGGAAHLASLPGYTLACVLAMRFFSQMNQSLRLHLMVSMGQAVAMACNCMVWDM